jgi:hypothetical protein
MRGHRFGESSRRQLGLYERQVQRVGRVVCAERRGESSGGDQESGVRVGSLPEGDDWVEQDGSGEMGESQFPMSVLFIFLSSSVQRCGGVSIDE